MDSFALRHLGLSEAELNYALPEQAIAGYISTP